MSLPASVASLLAWYEGDVKASSGLAFLAPRGWKCSAGIGENGSWGMSANPPGDHPISGPSVMVVGEYNGPGAGTACNFFPAAIPLAPVGSTCAAPSGTTYTLKDNHLAVIEAAPTVGKVPFAKMSFLLWYPEAQNFAQQVDCLLPAKQKGLCTAILDEALSRLRSDTEKLIAVVRSLYSPVTTAPAAPVANGVLARTSDGGIFIQWTLTSTQVQGSMTLAYTDATNPTQVVTQSHPFTGIVGGGSITITLDDGAKWNGTLGGGGATLSVTGTGGTVRTFVFTPANTDDFNSIVNTLKASAAAAQAEKAQQQQRQAQQQAEADAQDKLARLAQDVAADLDTLRQDASGLGSEGFAKDLEGMRKDVQQTAADLQAARHAPRDEVCTDAAGVGSDEAGVESDQAGIQSDGARLDSDLIAVEQDIGHLVDDWGAYQQLAAQWPSLTPPTAPIAAQVGAARQEAVQAEAKGKAIRAQAYQTAAQLVAQAKSYVAQANAACNAAGG